ncbi:MAG: threonine--tRNA ligase [Candidatus Yanofskybacteria bacterium RIFCSPLOWO2_02_FULL_43_10]|uniref:Threonine--tRNA ligase n=1 Tax=Candidatus Yanofskybacteria bacterium RIFCSPLOWO2_12_FULL_43_11b TaxID=1802710 RepID=A0A1F8H953_9BACT|nr:MAG: threonine--tRNA ligase [Candidatus Yanofskybacteria bacterium RIFCSPHIGHO2_01_FULL_43_32]OGN10582.1 MAG: threonine--tRNA ligase [Candidatus Yanofskybacteria bacterium RIFCSPHIGHO2_02_FULL_43_12]OGN17783.1 MAG: threonine--tRNA ligase [Candidatus Yanofskybacteria bacterium RIFCSPHIGHO2_12_FULL_43_11]OGN24527.1 MAG: threonine--tRNA ligase [Candidatus Yanofskybacteria bacterium RIFCSPLOWO2_01_FULL_43_46]OGN28399.1 MAG: threonine--tRNA ligase [Candidatus Yanofskybacteria bacterium RIFCSPLOWO
MPTPEETTKQDHRDIGQALDLFSFHEIAPGAPFWHPKGMIIFKELEKLARETNDKENYLEISTPILVKKEVFVKSGHWDHYRENMFYFANPRDKNEVLVIKPMNCPESTYVYSSQTRSYRDLPLRLAEIGRLNRNELSGTLGGLFRVRQITMDDAHIYLAPDQVEKEVVSIINTIKNFYDMFGFETAYVLATRPKEALGNKDEWDAAEKALKNALESAGVKYTIADGEGAFYGPKIEAHLQDSQNRDWQMGTAQLDLVMLPKQFDAFYTDENGQRKMPWVIHRAIFGSFERFIGVLLEHTGGALPLWLSPVQAAILPISDKQNDWAEKVYRELKTEGVRVEINKNNETLGKKIREAEMQKIPYLLIIGDKEIGAESVAVRKRGKGDIGQMEIKDFLKKIKEEISFKT